MAFPFPVVAASDASTQSKARADYVCDGTADNVEIQAAIDALPTNGGSVILSEGNYSCTSAIGVTKTLVFRGAGCKATQIAQMTTNTNLFQITSSRNHFSDFSCGARGTGNCFLLTNSHRSTYEDIETPAVGGYMFYLKGCLLNTFKRVMPSGNLGLLFNGDQGATNGFYLGYYGGIACNGNTLVGCNIECNTIGYYEDNMGREGNNVLVGGTIEGASTYGLYASNARGLQIFGTLFENPGAPTDIYLSGCVDSLVEPSNCGKVKLDGCIDTTVEGVANRIEITSTCKNCKAHLAGLYDEVLNFSLTSDVLASRDPGSETGEGWNGWGIYRRGVLINANSDLEDWTAGVPTGYIGSGTITKTGVGQGDTTTLNRNYSCKVTKITPGGKEGVWFTVPPRFIGQIISVEALFKNIDMAIPSVIWLMQGGYGVGRRVASISTTTNRFQSHFRWSPEYNSCDLCFGGMEDGADKSLYVDSIKVWGEYDPVN